MSLKTVNMYTVKCDRCGTTSGKDEEICAWNDADYAIEDAINGDWIEYDEKHYCNDCWQWNEDESEEIPKPESEQQSFLDPEPKSRAYDE